MTSDVVFISFFRGAAVKNVYSHRTTHIPSSLYVPCLGKVYERVGYYKVLCVYKHLIIIAYTETGGKVPRIL